MARTRKKARNPRAAKRRIRDAQRSKTKTWQEKLAAWAQRVNWYGFER